MTTKTLYGHFPTRRIGKVSFVSYVSFQYVCQAVPLHGQLLVPDVFFWAVDRLQIKFVASLWSMDEILF